MALNNDVAVHERRDNVAGFDRDVVAAVQDGTGAKVRWVRYNPDGYYNKNGGRVFHLERRIRDLETQLKRIFAGDSPLRRVDAPIAALYLFYGREPARTSVSHGWHNEIQTWAMPG